MLEGVGGGGEVLKVLEKTIDSHYFLSPVEEFRSLKKFLGLLGQRIEHKELEKGN